MLANQPLPVKGGPWKDICQLNIKEQRIREKMVTGLGMEVGNGRSTLFWEDNCLQGGPLKASFPKLFSISNQQGSMIGDCGFWDVFEWICNFQWRRELFQWELELVHQLQERLRPVKLSTGKKDNVVWKFDNKGVFSTNSFMQVLQSETLLDEITSYSFTSSIWRGVVPPRIEIFSWFVLVGRVNTKERMTRLGVIIHSNNICVLYKKDLESVQHLFLLYELTWQVWCTWLRSFGRAWTIPGIMIELFESWTGRHNRKQEQKMWLTRFFAVIWNIWLERNDSIFNNKEAGVEIVQRRTFLSYKKWTGSDPFGC
ncbi:uncharacterized protein LOC130961983 [Arachis stenosperma]|uniref:uncharacterized protein LOC130961983 n=1 Tax=Arachis stenosperma TaxID=217475 RepID=UPI0025AD390D|nr:uncharacterized protein LOC130961983 [Arachis stenosperma]XP_057744031.1 uncharacterized protein LOC130961983 [Arachis stenosperma]XP_057744037.1 uncharacterized protein LOC130961983 [Arachis stenosperma]XP_057744047.1 uncharacterized protein LOC130961983 [Arachis stenosperma]XP_057744056.1 uncharacterized protein LOC130961983 [Arachis stenosperma]XP_057744065.1 uncharacterized protein LOC130961983 [Arachis stenosperma]XP_057744069.1 uncharacterized protein LOC130961983 [Arachis stenosperm